VGDSYDAVVRSAAAAVGAEVCSLALYDAEADELIARRPRYTAAGRSVPQYRFPLAASPASCQVVRRGEAYISNDPASDPLYDASAQEQGLRSVLTVPVRRGQRVLGLLYALNKPGGFSEQDAQTLTALAGAAAVTLENIRLYADERERRVLNESLREVSRALMSTPTEDAALAAVLDQMWRVVRYLAAAAVVVEGETLRVAASRGGELDMELPLAEGGDLRRALEMRQTCMLTDAATLLPRLGMHRLGGRSLAAPLLAKGAVLGALVVAFEADGSSGLAEGQLINAFADHAALFLEAGEILRRERQARARAATLARITRTAVTRHEPESLLQSVAPELLALSGADRVALYLRHPRSTVLIPVADAGTHSEEQERVRELRLEMASEALAGLLEGHRPAVFDERANPAPSMLTPFANTRSQLLLPMVSRDEVIGAALLAGVGRCWTCEAAQVEFLEDVLQQVSLGVENARLFARLAQMASTDELTQLANRRRFTETFRLELSRTRRSSVPLSLVLSDIDHLKKINDGLGHPAGDAAIRHVAATLRQGRRDTDLVARLGGEEFALLLPATDLGGAVKAAERIRRELSESVVPGVGTVTVSLGVATCPEDGHTEQELIRVADERLYAAKSGGRNRVCYASSQGTLSVTAAAENDSQPEA
jgi:diguanylate cyclase (GGDEF)-like protein